MILTVPFQSALAIACANDNVRPVHDYEPAGLREIVRGNIFLQTLFDSSKKVSGEQSHIHYLIGKGADDMWDLAVCHRLVHHGITFEEKAGRPRFKNKATALDFLRMDNRHLLMVAARHELVNVGYGLAAYENIAGAANIPGHYANIKVLPEDHNPLISSHDPKLIL